MQESVRETWEIRKPAVTSSTGLVASQHHLASAVGAQVLRDGGNAVDAAVATGLTLGTVEPWMSGIGGGGYMTIYEAATGEVKVVEFGMQAPQRAQASDYPLADSGKNSADAFDWPAVVADSNIHGPLAIAVPGYLRGIELALSSFGTWSFADVIEPACQHAEWGLPIDWYSASKINSFARDLRRYEETARVYLGDGLPPKPDLVNGSVPTLPLGNLASTYRRLQRAGVDDFYNGSLAKDLVTDLQATGSRISLDDLAGYTANLEAPLSLRYRDSEFFVAGELTAGPSIIQALTLLQDKLPAPVGTPNGDTYSAFAESLYETYDFRLKHLGQGQGPATPTNTTHVCVTDSHGNVVSLTQTIMSGFGARIMLPTTGVLMNNGMMWFDPRPGGPNSVVGGRKPLCNMCPVIGKLADGSIYAAGACGGRKIFPAVFQLVSFLTDYGMDVDSAVHQPRIDVSGNDMLTIMASMPAEMIETLTSRFATHRVRPNGLSPNLFALPQVAMLHPDGSSTGGCFIPSPHAAVSAAH